MLVRPGPVPRRNRRGKSTNVKDSVASALLLSGV
jgi:hypothetical protein